MVWKWPPLRMLNVSHHRQSFSRLILLRPLNSIQVWNSVPLLMHFMRIFSFTLSLVGSVVEQVFKLVLVLVYKITSRRIDVLCLLKSHLRPMMTIIIIMFNISIAQISIWTWSNAFYNSRGNQINIAQITILQLLFSNQIKCWFLMRGENRSTRGKTSHDKVEDQHNNSIHIWHRVRKSNPGHIGGRQVLSPLGQPCHHRRMYRTNVQENVQERTNLDHCIKNRIFCYSNWPGVVRVFRL